MPQVSGIPSKKLDMNCKEPALPGIYYHYTSMQTLWAILESESLRATQARFSNDSEEIKKGIRIIKELCSQGADNSFKKYADWLDDGGGEEIDCYISCFCGGSDVLSQWRGYCRNDGVSIGFSFDETRPHYYFQNASSDEQIAQKIELFPVWYVGKKVDGNSKIISEGELKNILRKKILEIDESSDEQACKAFINATIPFIKHAGFCEEDEYRLLIQNTLCKHSGNAIYPLDDYIQYYESEGVKKPYITISFGKKKALSSVRQIRLYGLQELAETELRRVMESPPIMEKLRGKDGVEYQLINMDDWQGKPQIVIGEGENQKEIFKALDRILIGDTRQATRLFPDVKIWCEGHLPIHSIKVSPCENQKAVIESLRHYCAHNKFWMKYVDISGSETPYRRPK